MGWYDLRVPETRLAQAMLASRYGIHGFCYYHYWFKGKRLLHRPFTEVLNSAEPNFPFCLCWANETWSRSWEGNDHSILIKQEYSTADDVAHAEQLLPAFADSRAIRVNGRALFLIYRPLSLPDPLRTTEILRESCVRAGLKNPYLVGVNSRSRARDSKDLGFDMTLDFAPQLGVLPNAFSRASRGQRYVKDFCKRILGKDLKIYEYEDAIRYMEVTSPQYLHIPSVFVAWDNTPRRGREAIIMKNSTPELFLNYLRRAIKRAPILPGGDQIVFINAWNEWAEGNHLEPDFKYGHGYLESVQRAVQERGN